MQFLIFHSHLLSSEKHDAVTDTRLGVLILETRQKQKQALQRTLHHSISSASKLYLNTGIKKKKKNAFVGVIPHVRIFLCDDRRSEHNVRQAVAPDEHLRLLSCLKPRYVSLKETRRHLNSARERERDQTGDGPRPV